MESVKDTAQARRNFVDGAKAAYGKAKDLLNNLTGKPKDAEPKSPPVPRRETLEQIIQRLIGTAQNKDPILTNTESRAEFEAHAKDMITHGFHEGIVRKPSQIPHNKSASGAAELYARCFAALAENVNKLFENVTATRKIANDKGRQMNLHHSYQNYLQHHDKFNERGNTILEFIIYLVCSMIILLADVPLAAEMLKPLFDTPPKMEIHTGRDFLVVYSHYIAAIGISLSTIYIKIYYDEFAGQKFGHTVIAWKKFKELFKDKVEDGSITDKEEEAVMLQSKSVRRIKTVIFRFTLVAIAELGVYRGFAWGAIRAGGTVPIIVLSITLAVLTLLFAIVSGVCFSIALNVLTTLRRLRRCKKQGEELERSYADEAKKLSERQGAYAYALSLQDTLTKTLGWQNMIRDQFISFYDLGYSEGIVQPGYFMQGLDFFDRLVVFREDSIAVKINTHLNK